MNLNEQIWFCETNKGCKCLTIYFMVTQYIMLHHNSNSPIYTCNLTYKSTWTASVYISHLPRMVRNDKERQGFILFGYCFTTD
jgi:hypothetical protein